MDRYAYLITDTSWPHTLYEVKGSDPETDLVIIAPAGNPNRVLYVYEDDIWQLT
jgi:hypothetical protein